MKSILPALVKPETIFDTEIISGSYTIYRKDRKFAPTGLDSFLDKLSDLVESIDF